MRDSMTGESLTEPTIVERGFRRYGKRAGGRKRETVRDTKRALAGSGSASAVERDGFMRFEKRAGHEEDNDRGPWL